VIQIKYFEVQNGTVAPSLSFGWFDFLDHLLHLLLWIMDDTDNNRITEEEQRLLKKKQAKEQKRKAREGKSQL
jgi:hypothetical protein